MGVGATDFTTSSGRSTLTLATQATLAALEDAGIAPADVDGVVRCDMDTVSGPALADSLGARNLTYWGEAGPGGSGPAAMIGQAVGAILSGQAETVVVFRSLNGRSGDRFGKGSATTQRAGGGSTFEEFFLPYGMQTPGQFFALVAQRHIVEHGLTAEGLGNIALACRRHANNNPAAQMHHREMTMESYLASRMLSAPLRLFDFCLETDGACALVVTSTERSRDLRQPPVLIRAVTQATGPGLQPGMMFPALLREQITSWPSARAAETLYSRAGLGPQDVDVAQLYDCFTITALLQLEDYGFCKPGEGGAFGADGALEVGGALPINTAGGNLSEGYVHGMNHVVEGVRQIRGTSTNQVAGAEVSLVTSAPPPGASALMLVSS